jgi:hypothetical protein
MKLLVEPSHDDNETVASIDRSELQALIAGDERVAIVDVRSASDFADGHINGAVNIPVDELPARVRELPANSNVITVCSNGGARSCNAAAPTRIKNPECSAAPRWFTRVLRRVSNKPINVAFLEILCSRRNKCDASSMHCGRDDGDCVLWFA